LLVTTELIEIARTAPVRLLQKALHTRMVTLHLQYITYYNGYR